MRRSILIGMFLLLATAAYGKIYKWTDRNGTIHFTDNISAVPLEYRDQVEERKTTSSDATRPAQGTTSRSAPPSGMPAKHVVPLHGDRGALFVDVVLNGTLQTRLHIDTGATYTVLSRALAAQLRLNLERADIIPLTTANGVVLASLLAIDSVTVSGATVRDVDVVVHDVGGEGLLGMSFLSNFDVSLNTRDKEMILTEIAEAADTAPHAGRSEQWWRFQFAFYRRILTDIDAYLKDRPATRAEKVKLESALRLYQQKLTALERRANQAAVPRHWRY